MKAVRIMIADDHEIVRRGMRPLLKMQSGWEICGEAANGRDAVSMAAELKPDVVILDVSMPGLSGLEVATQIKRDRPETELLIFTGHESEVLVHQLFAAGARAFVLKQDAAEQLIPAVEALSEHRPFFGSQISMVVFEQYYKDGLSPEDISPDGLTSREREVVQLLAEGKSNKEVADFLGISVKTAETHRATVMRKLNLKAFSELIRFAIRNHLVAA